ncbi:hypothetical protein C8A03DRAFT_40959 [Achaetomium macrosporum]|uniref:DUF6546 domain-containing protein n=1 Tax=Achaetomium macrosporum TaxID=79813 RepID=A0AAN7HE12_9PEZI|nr:hypothetical protein C8A03DRAFT_40959 [Achaetomium macrosporum]
MSSISLGKKQWNSTWDGLPREIRLLILEALMQDGCTLARLATVSREWQTKLERYNFARIRLTPLHVVDFGSMIHRNRALVRYIWFCLELDDYDCTKCAPAHQTLTDQEWEEAFAVGDTGNCPITTAFQSLFSILSTWEPKGDLILDISIYSPSDSEHWFKYLTFLPETPSAERLVGGSMEQTISNKVYHDPQHGWIAGFRHSAPPSAAIRKVFHSIMEEGPFDSEQLELQWWDQLPSNRRRWKPRSLAHMFARFPRLQEVHYEPWREWDCIQTFTDRGEYYCIPAQLVARSQLYKYFMLITRIRYLDFQCLFESVQRFNNNLKRLTVFENFSQQYPASMQRFLHGVDLGLCDSIRNPAPAVSRMAARASLKLEHLAASFIVDASHFFEIEPSWVWPNLTSLVLTSKLLVPDENPIKIGAMLQAAAAAAIKMPKLKTMEIWNGRKGLAALFKYQTFRNLQQAMIIWRGTWKLAIEPSTIQAWEAVMHQYDDRRLDLVQERLDETAIKSHGDAIHYLMLSSQVIRPTSLRQIQIEQKALEGVQTV